MVQDLPLSLSLSLSASLSVMIERRDETSTVLNISVIFTFSFKPVHSPVATTSGVFIDHHNLFIVDKNLSRFIYSSIGISGRYSQVVYLPPAY